MQVVVVIVNTLPSYSPAQLMSTPLLLLHLTQTWQTQYSVSNTSNPPSLLPPINTQSTIPNPPPHILPRNRIPHLLPLNHSPHRILTTITTEELVRYSPRALSNGSQKASWLEHARYGSTRMAQLPTSIVPAVMIPHDERAPTLKFDNNMIKARSTQTPSTFQRPEKTARVCSNLLPDVLGSLMEITNQSHRVLKLNESTTRRRPTPIHEQV